MHGPAICQGAIDETMAKIQEKRASRKLLIYGATIPGKVAAHQLNQENRVQMLLGTGRFSGHAIAQITNNSMHECRASVSAVITNPGTGFR